MVLLPGLSKQPLVHPVNPLAAEEHQRGTCMLIALCNGSSYNVETPTAVRHSVG